MKNGEIFLIETGEYSDRGITAVLRAERDFDFDEELNAADMARGVFPFVESLVARGLASRQPILHLVLGYWDAGPLDSYGHRPKGLRPEREAREAMERGDD